MYSQTYVTNHSNQPAACQQATLKRVALVAALFSVFLPSAAFAEVPARIDNFNLVSCTKTQCFRVSAPKAEQGISADIFAFAQAEVEVLPLPSQVKAFEQVEKLKSRAQRTSPLRPGVKYMVEDGFYDIGANYLVLRSAQDATFTDLVVNFATGDAETY